MKNSTKKILTFLILPAAVLLFSGCGFGQKSTQNTEPAKVQTQTNASTEQQAKTTNLPSLPTDNKQAIDNEIQGIDQSIQAIDATTSADTQDGELGL